MIWLLAAIYLGIGLGFAETRAKRLTWLHGFWFLYAVMAWPRAFGSMIADYLNEVGPGQ